MNTELDDIIKKCAKIPFIEKRNVTDNSCELVFLGSAREELNKLFVELFGPPRKPAGASPTRDEKRLTKNFGGIDTFQKLFVRKDDDSTIIAVFRPWREDTHLTVKLGALKNSEIERHENLIIGFLKKLRILPILIFFLLTASFSLSDELKKTGSITLNLNQAITSAFIANRDIQMQVREVEAAQAQTLGAESEFLPTINLSGSYTYNAAAYRSGITSYGRDSGVFSGYKNDNLVDATGNVILFNGGYNIANYKQALVNLKIAKETLRSTRLDVEFETKRLYYGLLLAYETERIMRNLVGQAEDHAVDSKKKFEQGTVSRFDVLQSEVHVSTAIPDLVNAKSDIDSIKADFNKLLSMDIHDSLDVEGRLAHSSFIEVDENEFLDKAYLNNPDIILKSLGVDVSRYSIRMAEAGNLPTVEANASYLFRTNDVGDMINRRHNNWNVGVSVTVPIFDGFSAKAKVDEAKARYTKSALKKEDTKEAVAVDIRKACLDIIRSKEIIKSQEASLKEAKEALRLANVGYDNGVNTNLDVLDTQVALRQVERNLAEAIYDYLMALAQLDKIMGHEFLREEG